MLIADAHLLNGVNEVVENLEFIIFLKYFFLQDDKSVVDQVLQDIYVLLFLNKSQDILLELLMVIFEEQFNHLEYCFGKHYVVIKFGDILRIAELFLLLHLNLANYILSSIIEEALDQLEKLNRNKLVFLKIVKEKVMDLSISCAK